jgi:hypothetical protein
MQANAPDASQDLYYVHIDCPAPTPTSPAPDCFALQWFVGNTSLPYYDNTTLGTTSSNTGRKLMGHDDVQETQLVSMIRGSGLKQSGRVALAVTAALLDAPEALVAETDTGSSGRRQLLARQLLMHGGTPSHRRRSSRRRLDENGRPLPLTLKELAAEYVIDLSDPVQFAYFLHEHRYVGGPDLHSH